MVVVQSAISLDLSLEAVFDLMNYCPNLCLCTSCVYLCGAVCCGVFASIMCSAPMVVLQPAISLDLSFGGSFPDLMNGCANLCLGTPSV